MSRTHVALEGTAFGRDGAWTAQHPVTDVVDGSRADTGRRLALELLLRNHAGVHVQIQGVDSVVGAFRDDYRFELVNASPRIDRQPQADSVIVRERIKRVVLACMKARPLLHRMPLDAFDRIEGGIVTALCEHLLVALDIAEAVAQVNRDNEKKSEP